MEMECVKRVLESWGEKKTNQLIAGKTGRLTTALLLYVAVEDIVEELCNAQSSSLE